ncbi:DJ-1/PfpI family protein [Shewanella chilikensis]|uniref:DJ-1/PfpI family protein n=1 Tax=Shewanella chilikensis TaxID=558541 RepID=UPI00399BCD3D
MSIYTSPNAQTPSTSYSAADKKPTIAIVAFDEFTDIDLFLMWDILGRIQNDWQVKLLGSSKSHKSALGLEIEMQGHIREANQADAVLFISGKQGIPLALQDPDFINTFGLDPNKQLLGSICAGSFILQRLGLLDCRAATTHPDAKTALQKTGAEVLDEPLVIRGNIATAGGCLSAMYLCAWLAERLLGEEKRREMLRELLPAGQQPQFEAIIDASLQSAAKAAIQTACQ